MDRNEKITGLMDEGFARAKAGRYTAPKRLRDQIETLFKTTTQGFREIMVVVVVARLLDPGYKPSKALYACKPRAIYEGPILESLQSRGIPARKSGPLNIAKAAQGLTKEWAAQRRPKEVADEVVRLVKKVEGMSKKELEDFLAALLARLLEEATRVRALKVVAPPESDPQTLFGLCCALIDDVPDGGNTPQRIVGLLMEAYHEELQTEMKVQGHLDRASVASTTSKKPGDITEEQLDGTVLAVYEVTVKPFGEQRVRESYAAVRAYGKETGAPVQEVTVVCRGKDVHPKLTEGGEPSALYLGKIEHQDVTYHYLDIYEWMMGQLARMPSDARLGFHGKLADYVADPDTSEKVKLRWRELAI